MKVLFLGTPDFAIRPLNAVFNSKHKIVGVVSQPDRKTNRKGALLPTPTKAEAQKLGLPVYQFESVSRDGIDIIKSLNFDIAVTAAFGQILTKEFLEIPKFGIINVHASLLPKYRGAAPIQWAIINGEKKTGVTIMQTSLGIDTGDILSQRAIDISDTVTAGELFDELSCLGAELVVETLDKIAEGSVVPIPQDNALATKCGMIKKQLGELDFSKTPRELVNLVRGLTPFPGAYTFINGVQTKIKELRAVEMSTDNVKCGTVISNDREIVVACNGGAVAVTKLQAPGKNPSLVRDYLLGHRVEKGEVLGNKNA